MPRSRDRLPDWAKADRAAGRPAERPMFGAPFRFVAIGCVWTSRGIAGWLTTLTAATGDDVTVELGRTWDQDHDLFHDERIERALDAGWQLDEHVELAVKLEELAAYTMPPADRVDPLAAVWLADIRGLCERDRGVVTPCAWCVACGTGFIDRRVGSRHVASIARWCPAHRNRFHREMRQCAATDCRHGFWPASAKQVFCRPACARAAQRAASRPYPPN